MHAVHPNAFGQTIAMPPQSHPGLFANPGDPQGYGAPYGAPDSFPGASSNFPGGPYGHGPPHASSSQSTIETALSLPRPDAAAMWMAQQARVSPMRDKNTLVLIAVAVLTAICVLALGALIYFKKWKKPDPPPATSTTSMSTSAGEANGPPADAASQVALVAATTQHVAPSSPGQSATSTETGSAAEPPGPGYLTVICKPFCDNVRCAGTSLGASPVVKSPTPAGRHRVALTKKGSRGKSMNVDIEPGKTYTLRVDMK
jgi:serine/threonine-protein kinase